MYAGHLKTIIQEVSAEDNPSGRKQIDFLNVTK